MYPRNSCWVAPIASAVIAGSLLVGCAVGPNFKRPSAPGVTHYTNGTDPAQTARAQDTEQRFTPGAKVAADWWRLFSSRKLDGVITDALAHNPGLEAAQASLRQSENSLRSGYGIFFPQMDADAAPPARGTRPYRWGRARQAACSICSRCRPPRATRSTSLAVSGARWRRWARKSTFRVRPSRRLI